MVERFQKIEELEQEHIHGTNFHRKKQNTESQGKPLIIILILLAITMVFIFFFVGTKNASSNPLSSKNEKQLSNTIKLLKKQANQKCSQFILVQQGNSRQDYDIPVSKKISTLAAVNWVNTLHTDNELNENYVFNSKKCAIVGDENIRTQLFKYFMVRYLVLPVSTANAKNIQAKYQNQLDGGVKLSQVSAEGVQYFMFELPKPMTISKDGFWNGVRKEDLKQHHRNSLLLSQRLIQFYKKEKPSKIIDFGCGVCFYVAQLRKAGFNADGYDGNPYTKQISQGVGSVLNLIEPQDVGKADWVQSFEVGQHIPIDKTDIFVSNILKPAQKGIILSWAIRGQGGYGHINNKDNIQVIKIAEEFGFKLDVEQSIKMRNDPTLEYFTQSLMIFRKVQ